ncbi:hypothetical protein V6N12_038611 [Hibiscus sabdariffa]|uniref:Uncharacterized protein n=1 Tax=Hibiscus sabdariffa TaxID=183260 RepID=A0ABR2AL28_9ROSI
MLAMLYCMAILRLVNCVMGKTRKRTGISIAKAADAIGMPRRLIDVRHEGSHSHRGRQFKHLCGRSKFFSLMAGKVHASQSGGAKKQISKTLKSLVSLYSTSSSEVVSVLLEFLRKALDSSEDGLDKHAAWDDWQLVITKFSQKEPALLLALLQRILDMIGTKEASKYDTDHPTSSETEGRREAYDIEHLSSLFALLVRHLELKANNTKGSVGESVSNSILLELLSKCLLVSSLCNDHLLDSALHIAQLVRNSVLMEKLNKLRSLAVFKKAPVRRA